MLRNIALVAALFASTLSAHPLEAVKEKRGDDDWVSPTYTRIFRKLSITSDHSFLY